MFLVALHVSVKRWSIYIYNVTECIVRVSGHDPLTFSFLSFLLFDWVGVSWLQLSKVLKLALGPRLVLRGFQARSKDQEILEERGGAGPSHLPRRDHE